MPEISVGEKTCGKCGAELRRDTQYCYNCGDFVGEEAIPAPSESSLNIGKPLASSTPPVADAANRNGEYSVEDPKLTSAASLRRKGRAPQRKVAEVVWEPSGNRANLSLIISTVVLAAFTIVVILIALSSR